MVFNPVVPNSSPRTPPLCICCMSCQVNTHQIQITSSLEESYVQELCSDWHAPYTVFIAPYSLSKENLLKFLHTQTKLTREVWSVTLYTSINKYNLNSCLAHFNALWMEHIHSLRTGIMAEYLVMSTSQGTYDLWSNRTYGRDKI